MNWNEKFFAMVDLVASWSRDPSTKTGAVIVDDEHNVRSVGYNGFPRGVDDTIESRYVRPEKYKWMEHAERNAIFAAALHGTPTGWCSMYTAWHPCSDCARAIVQSGIKAVIIDGRKYKGDSDADARWAEDFVIARQILQEGGVDVEILDKEPDGGSWFTREERIADV